MANNPYNNKIQLSDGTTLIDLTSDTVTAANLAQGVTAHDASGAPITGTMSGGAVIIEDTMDSHGGTIREITATDVVNLQSGKTITPTTSSQTVTPDMGYDAFASVTVSAMPSGTAGTPTATKGTVSNHSVSVTPSVTNTTGYITGGTKTGTAVTVSASELVSGSQTITQNDTYNVTNLASVIVNVPSSGGNDFVVTVSEVNGVWTPDKTFAEIQTAYSAGKNIYVTSDNADSTASGSYDDEEGALYYYVFWYDYDEDKMLTNYYIFDSNGVTDDGGGELIPTPTETISITSNGTHDVTNYASAVVNVSGSSTTVTPLSVIQNGTYTAPTGSAYSPVTVNVPTGGGASNFVTGTFTGTVTGAATDISVNYSGSGYPVAIIIYPSSGTWSGDIASLVQRYACVLFTGTKDDVTVSPTYANTETTRNRFTIVNRYKNSTSDAQAYTQYGANGVMTAWNSNASESSSLLARMKSATTMSVFIASTSYGFAANIEYTYHVIYSS